MELKECIARNCSARAEKALFYQAEDYNLLENQLRLKADDGLNIWASEIYTEHPKAVIIYLSGIICHLFLWTRKAHAGKMDTQPYCLVRGHGKSDGDPVIHRDGGATITQTVLSRITIRIARP